MESQHPLPQREGNCKSKDIALKKKINYLLFSQFLNTGNDMLTTPWEALFSSNIMQLLHVCFLSNILIYWNGSTLFRAQGQIYCETTYNV